MEIEIFRSCWCEDNIQETEESCFKKCKTKSFATDSFSETWTGYFTNCM